MRGLVSHTPKDTLKNTSGAVSQPGSTPPLWVLTAAALMAAASAGVSSAPYEPVGTQPVSGPPAQKGVISKRPAPRARRLGSSEPGVLIAPLRIGSGAPISAA